MANKKKLSTKNIFLIIFLCALFLGSWYYWDNLKFWIRDFLDAKLLYVSVFGITIILSIVAYFSKIEIDESKLIINNYGSFIDITTSGLTYATGISSSLALIKGFYIQKVIGGTQYFLLFTDFDQWLLILTMTYLLYFCLKRIIDIFSDVIYEVEAEEIT